MRREHETTVEAAIFDENRDLCYASEARNDRPNTIRRKHETTVRTRFVRNGPAGNSCPMFLGRKRRARERTRRSLVEGPRPPRGCRVDWA